MKKIICLIILIISLFSTQTGSSTLAIPISPITDVYKEGIYQLDKGYTGEYNLECMCLKPQENSSLIILDEHAYTLYKNADKIGKFNAGIVTNEDTIILVTDSEAELIFTKIKN